MGNLFTLKIEIYRKKYTLRDGEDYLFEDITKDEYDQWKNYIDNKIGKEQIVFFNSEKELNEKGYFKM